MLLAYQQRPRPGPPPHPCRDVRARRVCACAAADTFIQKTKKLYMDTRTQRNLAKLNDDLAEVHSIMTRNIAEVLGQGEKLDSELGGRGLWEGVRSLSLSTVHAARMMHMGACAHARWQCSLPSHPCYGLKLP